MQSFLQLTSQSTEFPKSNFLCMFAPEADLNLQTSEIFQSLNMMPSKSDLLQLKKQEPCIYIKKHSDLRWGPWQNLTKKEKLWPS